MTLSHLPIFFIDAIGDGDNLLHFLYLALASSEWPITGELSKCT
jgi:hypothetical protein